MATRDSLRTELKNRLGDPTNVVWANTELDGYLDFGIKGLYPAFYKRNVATTTGTASLIQAAPANCTNIYLIGLQRVGTSRIRNLRGWAEGSGSAYIPKGNLLGETLIWAWTTGWSAPATGAEVLTIPQDSEEVVLLRAHITALEKLLSDRVSADEFIALQAREGVTENDVATTLEALHRSLADRLAIAQPLPEVIR